MRILSILSCAVVASLLASCDDRSYQVGSRADEPTGEIAFRLSPSVSQRISLDADSVRLRVSARGQEVAVTFPANVPGDLIVPRITPANGATVTVEAFYAPNVVTWSGTTQVDIVGGRRVSATVTLRPVYGSLDVELTLDSLIDSEPAIPAPRFDTTQWGRSEIPLVNIQLARPAGTDSVVCRLASGVSRRCDSIPVVLYQSQTISARSHAGRKLSDEVVDSVTVGGDFLLSYHAGHSLGFTAIDGSVSILPPTATDAKPKARISYFESGSPEAVRAPVISFYAPDTTVGLLFNPDSNLRLNIVQSSLPWMYRSYSVQLGYVVDSSWVTPQGTLVLSSQIWGSHYIGYDVALQYYRGGYRSGVTPLNLYQSRLKWIQISVAPQPSNTSSGNSIDLEFDFLRFH